MVTDAPDILIISGSPQGAVTNKLREMLRLHVGNHSLAVAATDSAEQMCLPNQMHLVLVVLSSPPDLELELISRLRSGVHCKLVAVGDASESNLILRALRNGADHYLDQAEAESELSADLSRLMKTTAASARAGSLVVTLSASGGCGSSTVAVNLAAALAKKWQHCVLMDLHMRRGDLASLLDLKPEFTLADLCRNEARLDQSMFERILVEHSSGIRLLAAPPPSDFRTITVQGILQALSMARSHHARVLVDLDDCFQDEQTVTLQQATGIFLVCRLDFAALRNARDTLGQLKRLDIPRHRIQLVINRFGRANELPVSGAEDALGEKLTVFIPDDPRTINGANNVGIPAVIQHPSSKVAQSLVQLTNIDFATPSAIVPGSSANGSPAPRKVGSSGVRSRLELLFMGGSDASNQRRVK
jgi:pilus assembly protein CpaE